MLSTVDTSTTSILSTQELPLRTSFIVVAYQSDQWLLECVQTLAASWNARDRLWIVDNSGNSRIEQCTGLVPGTRVIQTPTTLGFAEANNFALLQGALDGEFVCLLNQDTLSGPGWIDACISAIERRSDVGAVSPLLKTWDGVDWDAGFAACVAESPQLSADLRSGVAAGPYDVPRITAAAMLVRSDVLRRVGPFDPIFGSYYEDFDLCRRIREAGFRIEVCGQGVVRHFGGSTSTTTAARDRRTRQVLRNRAIARVREAGDRRIRAFLKILCSIPRNLLRGVVRTPSSQPVHAQLAAYFDLLRLAPRIMSAQRDSGIFDAYLREIGWPAR